jgi:hypothetical protein
MKLKTYTENGKIKYAHSSTDKLQELKKILVEVCINSERKISL